jgi:hypothetical protein
MRTATPNELTYVSEQRIGRLATADRNGRRAGLVMHDVFAAVAVQQVGAGVPGLDCRVGWFGHVRDAKQRSHEIGRPAGASATARLGSRRERI